jgi:hypothetical protein
MIDGSIDWIAQSSLPSFRARRFTLRAATRPSRSGNAMLWGVSAVFVAVSMTDAHADQDPTLVVRIHNAASLTVRELTIAKDQVNTIWSREGIHIRWDESAASGPEIGLDVTLDRSMNFSRLSSGRFALAVTRICQSDSPAITVTLAAIEQFVNVGISAERPFLVDSVIIHQTLTGRVVGRSIAHEIGHVLLRSSEHAREGLMRPQLTTAELFADDMNGFRLTAQEHERLRLRLSPKAEPSILCDGLLNR